MSASIAAAKSEEEVEIHARRRVRAGDAGLVEASAQRESLGQLSDAQPVGASLEGRERDGDKPVPVGVRLDGGELEASGAAARRTLRLCLMAARSTTALDGYARPPL